MTQALFDLYAWNTPNGQKIVMALEEIEVEYRYRPVDITAGEQHTDAFKALSPDGKIPVLVHRASSGISVFESGAILLYLAQLYPSLTGATEADKTQVMSWVFWQVGQLGPLAGQFGRFQRELPKNPSAIEHFEQLVWRCLKVMEHRLSQSDYLGTDRFTVADIACLPWVASPQSYLQRYDIRWQEQCPLLAQWSERLHEKPSVRTAFSL